MTQPHHTLAQLLAASADLSARVDRHICELFDGSNYAALQQYTGLSHAEIRQAIQRHAAASPAHINAATATAFDQFDAAHQALQQAYRNRMDVVMAGLVGANSPKVHCEWLEEAELCLAQFQTVSVWIASQTTTALPQSAQSSAA